MQNFLCQNQAHLDVVAQKILDQIKTKETKGAGIIALFGNLGAGKTTLTKTFAKVLGVRESVKSPTFLIMETYPINFDRFHRFIHIDTYRLDKLEELVNLGFMGLLKEKENLMIIEWPEKITDLIPEAIRINLKYVDEKTREISWN